MTKPSHSDLMAQISYMVKKTPEELRAVAAALEATGGAQKLMQDARHLVADGFSAKDAFDLLAAESDCPRRERLAELLRDQLPER